MEKKADRKNISKKEQFKEGKKKRKQYLTWKLLKKRKKKIKRKGWNTRKVQEWVLEKEVTTKDVKDHKRNQSGGKDKLGRKMKKK